MKLCWVTGPSIYYFMTDNMTTLLVKVGEANSKGGIGDSKEIVCEKRCIQLIDCFIANQDFISTENSEMPAQLPQWVA